MHLLEHLRVIDAASYLAGPGAATVLGDYGADVIKVEPLGGDGYRALAGRGPVPYTWLLTSRNKRSIAIDIRQPDGHAVLLDLVRGADVFITNFRPAQLVEYRIGHAALLALNPRLVYAHLTGYGPEGPDADRRAFDSTAWWARSGMMDFVREPGQDPQAGVPGFGDHATAMSLFGAIMLALYRRERTGEGGYVHTSLLANGAWANGMNLQGMAAGVDVAAWRQQHGWRNPFTGVYRTADDRHVQLGAIAPVREWPRLARALGHPEWVDEPRFAPAAAILRHQDALAPLFAQAIRAMTLAEVEAALAEAEIACGSVARNQDVLTDPQALASGCIRPTGSDEPGWQVTVDSPLTLDGVAKVAPRRAPDIGADTRAILRGLGYDEPRIAALVAAAVVRAGD